MKYGLSNALPYFEQAFRQTDRIFFVFDVVDKKFLFTNAAFESLIKDAAEEALSTPKNLLSIVHEEDINYVVDSYNDIVRGVQKHEIRFRVETSDNTRWLDVTPYLIDNTTENMAMVVFAEDITEKKDKEDLVHEYASKKDSILEILSHDLAGPLTKIKALASLMSQELDQHDHPSLDEMVGMIEETSERSIRLIREFVKQEFLHSKNSSLVKERENIVEKMQEVMTQYKDSADKILKIFRFNTTAEKIYVHIDAYKFSQVINNLISNAIKFTPDGGIITLSVEDKRNTVLITVADNGIGIPVKYHANLFEKFTEARRPGLKGEPSVGLGMSIIKTIIEWHKGKIWFESEEGEGATFYIEIPKE